MSGPRFAVRPYAVQAIQLTQQLLPEGSIKMNAMRAVPIVDPQPVLELIQQRGECTFDEALDALVRHGFSQSSARDALWQLLSDGRLEFTAKRNLRAPGPAVSGFAAGSTR